MERQEGDHKMLCKGIEDWCNIPMSANVGIQFTEETTIVIRYPDCLLYIGLDKCGTIQGRAKVVDEKIMWVVCNEFVPRFKERFYEKY